MCLDFTFQLLVPRQIGNTLSCIKHDRLPFSVIYSTPRVFSVPKLIFYLLPLAFRILQSGEKYLQDESDIICGFLDLQDLKSQLCPSVCLSLSLFNFCNNRQLTSIWTIPKLSLNLKLSRVHSKFQTLNKGYITDY